MTVKPVVPRELARRDVDEAVDRYTDEAADEVALRFIDSLRRTYAHIGRHPASGSPRWAQELDIPGLRSWPVGRIPHLVFYVERRDHVDVWRVLDGRRDIPARCRIRGLVWRTCRSRRGCDELGEEHLESRGSSSRRPPPGRGCDWPREAREELARSGT